jgi:hypothetical protein
METYPPFARAFGERLCLVAWMILMIATTVMIGLSVELIFFGAILSFDNVTLIGPGCLPFLGIGFAAALNFPIVVKLHELGVNHLHFELHESIMSSASESWENIMLTLLDDTGLRSHQLGKLVDAINNATCAAERQERRREAKAWLVENKDRLSEEDKELVIEQLSYLKI